MAEAMDLERYRFIPLRLSSHERTLLEVVDGALDTCEYTDNVDVSRSDYYVVTAYDKNATIVQPVTVVIW